MGLRDIGDTLPPGFRFYPSDEELVCHYLYKKIANEEVLRGTLVEIDLHVCEPWQLPDVAKLNSNEWYFFSFRDRKYATGFRTTERPFPGTGRQLGKDRSVVDPRTRKVVGMRKTLVFYKNRAPNGIKTGWIMHEFRLENPHVPPKEDWVLCRVFHKSRSENYSNKLMNEHNFYDSIAGATSPTNNEQQQHGNYMPNYAHQNIITSFNHQHSQTLNPSTSLALSPLDPGYVDLCREDHMNHEPGFSSSHYTYNKMLEASKCEDDYGFLLDLVGSNAEPSES